MLALDALDVFYGDLTVARGYVYARLPRGPQAEGLSLGGFVRGPRCLHAQTLPLSSPLVDRGPGPTLLAQAMIPDPCFWTPDLPAVYDATVHLLRGTEIVATAHREIGLRRLGVRGRNLALEGKRWVLRGVMAGSTTATFPRAWHEVAAEYVTNAPDEALLAEASEWGAMTVVELDAGPQFGQCLRELARFPGVAMALVRGSLSADFQGGGGAPNLLLAQRLDDAQDPQIAAWADLAFAAADDADSFARLAAAASVPVVAMRPLAQPLPLDVARAACDRLQRDLAPIGQLAGYVV